MILVGPPVGGLERKSVGRTEGDLDFGDPDDREVGVPVGVCCLLFTQLFKTNDAMRILITESISFN